MSDYHRPPGKTTIAPEVLITIARMAALNVPGVSAMAPIPGGVDRYFRRGVNEGIRLALRDNVVTGDLFIIVKDNVNIREVGRNVQQQVSRAIQEMVGMDVVQLDVHIENIQYEGTDEA
jgi:uncharacterized alkaline shock family protein YloU